MQRTKLIINILKDHSGCSVRIWQEQGDHLEDYCRNSGKRGYWRRLDGSKGCGEKWLDNGTL